MGELQARMARVGDVVSATLAVGAGVALLVSWLVNRWLLAIARPALLDHPNERSLHEVPVPRGGGIGIVAGTAAGVGILGSVEASPVVTWLGGAGLTVAAVSLADDLRGLPPLVRLGVHALAGVMVVAAGVAPDRIVLPGMEVAVGDAAGTVFTLFFVVWLVNLYNFMDGMDGLAAGMAVVGFGTCAALGFAAGAPVLAGVALCAAFASFGFGRYNFPPARIFMGDVGSSFLGALAAGIGLWADAARAFPLWITVLVFSPFIVDATVTLARRLLSRERVWEAHRSHYYQRLVRAGWTHRRTVLCEYLVMGLSAAGALAALRGNAGRQWTVIAVAASVYLVLAVAVTRAERLARRSPRSADS